MKMCSICSHKAVAKGLCKRHYQQQWRTGNPTIVRPNPHGTPVQRWVRQVRFTPGCWEWTGHRDKDGYGTLKVGRRTVRAHRFSYELFYEVIGAERLRHTCNNTWCVNPTHLVVGDHLANMADRKAAGHYATGEAHHRTKFSDSIADLVRAASGTYAEIGKRFGMSASQVGNIKRGKHRKGPA